MKGKWEGELTDELSNGRSKNLVSEYLDKNSRLEFSLRDYEKFLNAFLDDFDLIENGDDQKEIENIFTELLNLVAENPSMYGGCVYLFKTVVYNLSENEVYLDLDFDLIKANSYSLERMLEEGTPVKIVCIDYEEEEFKLAFITKMLFTLLTVIDETDDYELIAELIVGSNINQYTNSLTEDTLHGDWVSDIVIDILRIIGYDIYDYEETIEIEGRYFMDSGQTMGFDYVRLAEKIYESNI